MVWVGSAPSLNNLDIANLYLTKSLVYRTIFFAPVIVKYMKKNLDITKPRTNVASPLALLYIEVSLYKGDKRTF